MLTVKMLDVTASARLQHIDVDMIIFWKHPTMTKHSCFSLKHFYANFFRNAYLNTERICTTNVGQFVS